MKHFDTEDLTIALLRDQLDATRLERDELKRAPELKRAQSDDWEKTTGAQIVLCWYLCCICAVVFGFVQLVVGLAQ